MVFFIFRLGPNV